MKTPYLVELLIVVGVAVLVLLVRLKKGGIGVDIYRRQEQLFSAPELRFLAVLDQSIEPGHRVFGKVRLADLAGPRSGLNPRIRQVALNRIAQKHVDFLVCFGPSLIPVCAVELNDSSHNSGAAKRRDELVASVCAQIGLPLVVVKAAKSYSADALRQQLDAATQVTRK